MAERVRRLSWCCRASVNTTLYRSSSVVLALLGALLLSRAAWAQDKPKAPGFPDAPGKETLLAKCFQCHSAGMWMDHRQDRRGWESVLYRMVGRGALRSEEHTSELQSRLHLVCRLLLEKKKKKKTKLI